MTKMIALAGLVAIQMAAAITTLPPTLPPTTIPPTTTTPAPKLCGTVLCKGLVGAGVAAAGLAAIGGITAGVVANANKKNGKEVAESTTPSVDGDVSGTGFALRGNATTPFSYAFSTTGNATVVQARKDEGASGWLVPVLIGLLVLCIILAIVAFFLMKGKKKAVKKSSKKKAPPPAEARDMEVAPAPEVAPLMTEQYPMEMLPPIVSYAQVPTAYPSYPMMVAGTQGAFLPSYEMVPAPAYAMPTYEMMPAPVVAAPGYAMPTY
jgi:hypothetical protein